MEIKSMGIRGNINTHINVASLLSLSNNFSVSHGHGKLSLSNSVTACIYSNGSVQIYGVKKIEDVKKSWEKVLNFLSPLVDISKADSDAVVKFLVASEKLPYALNLPQVAKFASESNEIIEYEPEQFPWLIWRLPYGTCLLYTSGSLVITGSKSPQDVKCAIKYIDEKLREKLICLTHPDPSKNPQK